MKRFSKGPRATKISWRAALWPCLAYNKVGKTFFSGAKFDNYVLPWALLFKISYNFCKANVLG